MSRQDEKKHKTEQERETSVPKRKIIFVPLQSEKSPKGEPRYRDPANPFNTWVGRGKRPDWLKSILTKAANFRSLRSQNKELTDE